MNTRQTHFLSALFYWFIDIDLISRKQEKFFTFIFHIEALRTTTMFDVERHHPSTQPLEVFDWEKPVGRHM
jgi:hypothetical protein